MFKKLLVICWLILTTQLSGQDCHLVLTGHIHDAGTEESLAFANVYLEESKQGTVADEAGQFRLEDICPGDYHLLVRHIGCEPERIFLQLTGSQQITVELLHHTELIDEVIVHGQAEDNTTQTSSSLNEVAILKKGDTNLGNLLDDLTGVSTLRNGAGISKPIIHGLFGNRISILNNGIAQSGQQWGNDHAPEIDPFVADHLSVLKGVAALEYGGSSLGGVVLVEPGSIENEPHLHGRVSYLLATNGRGHTLNTRLAKGGSFANWRFTGTLKKQGDSHTPDYFLRNTGRKEASAAIQLEKQVNERFSTDLYLSYFATTIGVLRGSHIGNLTDLEAALSRDVPFFTEPDFSYAIDAPKQVVQHSLIKWSGRYALSNNQYLNFTYAGQLNARQEFDVRRGNRTDRAALRLRQWSHFFAVDYSRPAGEFSLFKTGIQTTFTDNYNVPGTGIFPLIPNYDSWAPTAFATLRRERGKWRSELGLRYAFTSLDVVTLDRGPSPDVVRYSPSFHAFSSVAGLAWLPLQNAATLKFSANLGLATRPPAVNELYSNGLHQGVSGIEEGDIDLGTETSLKGTLGVNWSSGHLFIQALTYYQRIENFIYLQPQPDFRLTIRGSFPVFKYRQTEAELAGLDLLVSIEPSEQLKLITQYSYLRGTDLSNQQPLVFMPPNRLSSRLEYAFGDGEKWSNTSLNLEGEYTFRQGRFEEDQDLALAPDGYFLLSANLGTHLQLNGSSLHFNLRVDNLLNVRYRDYLNRLRYFSDELGRNIVAGISWEF